MRMNINSQSSTEQFWQESLNAGTAIDELCLETCGHDLGQVNTILKFLRLKKRNSIVPTLRSLK